jgi:hypothetical protein
MRCTTLSQFQRERASSERCVCTFQHEPRPPGTEHASRKNAADNRLNCSGARDLMGRAGINSQSVGGNTPAVSL